MSKAHPVSVNFVYWIAAALGHKAPSYAKAWEIAEKYDLAQLMRIHRLVKGRGIL